MVTFEMVVDDGRYTKVKESTIDKYEMTLFNKVFDEPYICMKQNVI